MSSACFAYSHILRRFGRCGIFIVGEREGWTDSVTVNDRDNLLPTDQQSEYPSGVQNHISQLTMACHKPSWRQLTVIALSLSTLCLFLSWRGAGAAHSQKRVTARTRVVYVYDRSITTFDPNGRLLQVEYGAEAANRASPIVAVVIDETIYIAIPTTTMTTTCPIHRLDHHLFLVATGLAGDALAVARQLRQSAAQHRLSHGEPSTVLECATEVATLQHGLTKQPGARPLGVTALIVGLDSLSHGKENPRLYRSNPGGTLEDCYYAAAGKNQDTMMRVLDRLYPQLASSSSSSSSSSTESSPATVINALGTVLREALTDRGDKQQPAFDAWIIRPGKEGRGGTKVTCVQGISHSISVSELRKTLMNLEDPS